MNVLVTGGTGYIGAHLANALRGAGHAVRVLDLQPPPGPQRTFEGRAFLQGSVADTALAARAIRDIEVVYHLAWGSYPGEEWREIEANLVGTLNLLQAALAAGVRHLLFASSAVVYGPTGPVRVGEGHHCHPECSTIGGPVYGIAKLACEHLCLVYQRRGLPVTVFRLHGVFSRDRLGQFGGMIHQALAEKPVTAYRGAGGEYIHLHDLLCAFRLTMRHPQAYGQVFNLAGAHTYRETELARYAVERAESASEIVLLDDPTQGMISVAVEKARRLLGFEPEKGEFLTTLIQGALQGGC
jgi:UDP-glucose 4-epimerase